MARPTLVTAAPNPSPGTRRGRRAAIGAALGVTLVLSGTGWVNPAASASAWGCQDTSVAPTVEENRLVSSPSSPGAQILDTSDLGVIPATFLGQLCGSLTLSHAAGVVATQGTILWDTAVARARGLIAVSGTLPGNDDRPLYWARLSMTLMLRRWTPPFPISAGQRADLMRSLERTSRGMTTADFDTGSGRTQFFVSGFDPFSLDSDGRRGNPAGAAALALDGAEWTAPDGHQYEVQAVMFPVRYADFSDGEVEDVYAPVFTTGTNRSADIYATISQGRPGIFDLEAWNGRRRSTTAPDNNNLQGGGTFTNPVVPPGMPTGPEFIASTLPITAMQQQADNQPFPVRVHTSVVEIPAGGSSPVFRSNGPTPGSIAVRGGGGAYLSNEIAYRATLQRDLAGTGVPGGHIHTPVLEFDPNNSTDITDPIYEQNRDDIVDQVQLLIEATD